MRRAGWIIGLAISAVILVLIVLTAVLVPANLSPAYQSALAFTGAALRSRDAAAAMRYLSPELAAWVNANCPGGVSACIHGYLPDEWGDVVDIVYRRSIPDGATAWDVLLIASFSQAQTQGFSGVCIYQRVERLDPAAPDTIDAWKVVRWSGWIPCDEPNAGLEELRSEPDAPNQAP